MKNPLFVHNFPDLLEIQKTTYFWFLLNGISEEMGNFLAFFEDNSASYFLSLQDFFFVLPTKTDIVCKQEDLSYTLEIFVPVYIEYNEEFVENEREKAKKPKKKTKKKIIDLDEADIDFTQKVLPKRLDVCIGEIPLMTDQSSFVINGIERVVINQLVRSPGVYLQRETDNSGNQIYSAFIISHTGNWFRIEFWEEKKKTIFDDLFSERNDNFEILEKNKPEKESEEKESEEKESEEEESEEKESEEKESEEEESEEKESEEKEFEDEEFEDEEFEDEEFEDEEFEDEEFEDEEFEDEEFEDEEFKEEEFEDEEFEDEEFKEEEFEDEEFKEEEFKDEEFEDEEFEEKELTDEEFKNAEFFEDRNFGDKDSEDEESEDEESEDEESEDEESEDEEFEDEESEENKKSRNKRNTESNFESRFKISLDNGYELPLSFLLLALDLDEQTVSKKLKNLEFIDEIFLDYEPDFTNAEKILYTYECFFDESIVSNLKEKYLDYAQEIYDEEEKYSNELKFDTEEKEYAKELSFENGEKDFENQNLLSLDNIINVDNTSLDDTSSLIKNNFDRKNQKLHEKVLEDNAFFNTSKYFSVGRIGRYQLNKKFHLGIQESIDLLTPNDLLAIIDAILELKKFRKSTDEIDDLGNKRVRSTGEILKNIFSSGLERLKRHISEIVESKTQKLAKILPEKVLDSRFLTSSFKEFFSTSELSQFLDDVNPLADITHKRRVTVLGIDGVNQENSSLEIRDIHPSHYGRLCPIETPEGLSAGLVNTLACCVSLNSFGFLESPFFLCDKGRVFINSEPIFMDSESEKSFPIGSADVLIKNIYNKYYIEVQQLPVKYNDSFYLVKSKSIDLMYISPIQLLSIATSLVPFLEHNDANRVLMGANMQRQAVPLLYPQKPLVGTGMEFLVAYDSGMIVKSYNEGYVDYSSSEKIVVEDNNNQFITYTLLKYTRTNSDTCINQKPLVWPGEKVYAGQIIADGPSILEGELSLGRNLNLAYMTWEGYNFEDAVVISERVVIDDLLTSINIETYETEVYDTEFGAEILTTEIAGLSVANKKLLTTNGIIKEGSYVKGGDVLIGKLTPQQVEETGESKLYQAVFGKKLESQYLDSSLRLSKGSEGRVIDVRVIDKNRMIDEEEVFEDASPLANSLIRVYIAQIRKIETGDKVSGRHGNKGIISKILPVQDMPYLPDGTPIDIIFNPLGIPSRMNIGQIFECLLGFAAEKLTSRFKVIPFDESFGKDISRNLVNQKLKEASIKSSLDWVFNEYSPGKILLTDGRTGEIFDNPVLVGKSYILKLFHLVEDKIHARATGPYSLIYQQPLGGRSSKGGQRFGEMEVWALQAYGAAYTLQELLTIKSDDIEGRDYTYQALTKDRIPAIPKVPESFNILTKQLQALGLDLTTYKINLNPYDKTKNLIEEKTILSAFENELQIKLENREFDSPQRISKELSKTDLKNTLISDYDKKTIQNFNKIKNFLNTKK